MTRGFLVLLVGLLLVGACVFAMSGSGDYEYEVSGGDPDSIIVADFPVETTCDTVPVPDLTYCSCIEIEDLPGIRNAGTDSLTPDSTDENLEDEFDLLDDPDERKEFEPWQE